MVALGLGNTVEHVIVTFAAWKLGAMVLPLRPELPTWERTRLLELAGPRLLVGDWPDGPAGMLSSADVRGSSVNDDGLHFANIGFECTNPTTAGDPCRTTVTVTLHANSGVLTVQAGTTGGFTLYAKETAVSLVRDKNAYTIDVKLAQKNPAQDPRLMPGDSIQVSRSPF